MARQTRQQRRARREEQQRADGGTVVRARGRQAQQPQQQQQQQVRPSPDATRQDTARREPRQRGRFVRESWGELQKVEWPGRNQVMQGTVVVLIACAIVGVYLWGADQLFRPLVENVFLGQ